MIVQLSDWFTKPMILAIIVKFDQIRQNCWLISCAEILEVEKNVTKTVILLGLAGYELIITNSAYGLVGYIYQLIPGASSKNNC